jgi:hypothetical protein
MIQQKEYKPNPVTDVLATAIAVKIIQWQREFSAGLNVRANRVAVARQKLLLAIFCLLTCGGLILCVVFPFGKLAMHNQASNYQATHIGLPSTAPNKQLNKPTDSLTISK